MVHCLVPELIGAQFGDGRRGEELEFGFCGCRGEYVAVFVADGAVAFAHAGRGGVEGGAIADVAAVAAARVRLLGRSGGRHG